MILINEIRIGLIFRLKVGPLYKKDTPLKEIGREDLILLGNRGEPWLNEEYKPVPITPEILESCGFVKSKRRYGPLGYRGESIVERDVFTKYKDPDREIKKMEILYGNIERGKKGFKFGKTQVLYFHQLQNIYFSLFAEEITIEVTKGYVIW